MCIWSKFGATSTIHLFYRSLPFLFAFPVCHAVLVNRTIDSNIGDPVTGFVPVYQPRGPWTDQTCSTCWIQPDISKAFDSTWEATTYHPAMHNANITLRFTGVAIWVFFILANANDHGNTTTSNTQVNITLDGHYAGNFSHDPDMTTHDLLYNQTIFSTTGLANTSHILVIATNNYPVSTYLNFDWAIYTVDIPASQNTSSSSTTSTSPFSTDNTSSPSPTSHSASSNIGVIVGCTLGGLVVIILLLFFLDRRRRQNKGARGILDINVTPLNLSYGEPQARHREPSPSSGSEHTYFQPPSYATQPSVPIYGQERRYTTRLQEARQMEIDNRIQSPQHEAADLGPVRNVRSVGDPSSAVPLSHGAREIASLRNEVQQLRDQIQPQREPNRSQSLFNESLPPAYT